MVKPFKQLLLSDILTALHRDQTPPLVPYLEKDLTLVLYSLLKQRDYPVALEWKKLLLQEEDNHLSDAVFSQWFPALTAHGETLNFWNQSIFEEMNTQRLLWEAVEDMHENTALELIEKAMLQQQHQVNYWAHLLDFYHLQQETQANEQVSIKSRL